MRAYRRRNAGLDESAMHDERGGRRGRIPLDGPLTDVQRRAQRVAEVLADAPLLERGRGRPDPS